MGHDPRGRRHDTPAWLDMRLQGASETETYLARGKSWWCKWWKPFKRVASQLL